MKHGRSVRSFSIYIPQRRSQPKLHKYIDEQLIHCFDWNENNHLCYKKATKSCCGAWRCKKHHKEHLAYGFAHIEIEERDKELAEDMSKFWEQLKLKRLPELTGTITLPKRSFLGVIMLIKDLDASTSASSTDMYRYFIDRSEPKTRKK